MEKESAILELYEYVQMNKTSSKEYSMKLRKFIEAKENFDKQLIDVQKEQLEKLLELCGDMHGQEFKEYFIAGFTLATKLMAEVFINKNENEEWDNGANAVVNSVVMVFLMG